MVSATSNKPKAGDALPTTRCTNCQTVFELPDALLESADSRVRCGECLCIFDARDGLVSVDAPETLSEQDPDVEADPAVNPLLSKPTEERDKNKAKQSARVIAAERKRATDDSSEQDDASALDVTYSDFDLFSEEADLPALAYLDETRDTPEFDFDAVELGDEENFSDTLFAHDVTINADLPIAGSDVEDADMGNVDAESLTKLQRADVDFAVDKVPVEPLIFKYEDPPAKDEESVDEKKNADSIDADESSKKNKIDVPVKATKISQFDNSVAYVPVESELALDVTKKRFSGMWVWLCGVVLLLGVLIATVVYPRWASLDQSPTFRPIKVAACGLFGCQVNTRVDIDQLKVLKREVFEVAGRDNALSINIKLQNTANFAQRYPVVEARMTNRVGRSVAQRAFTPRDYLPNWNRGEVLEANEIVDIELIVNDPGTAAEHHVLQLRELRLDCEPTTAPDGSERWPVDCAKP